MPRIIKLEVFIHLGDLSFKCYMLGHDSGFLKVLRSLSSLEELSFEFGPTTVALTGCWECPAWGQDDPSSVVGPSCNLQAIPPHKKSIEFRDLYAANFCSEYWAWRRFRWGLVRFLQDEIQRGRAKAWYGSPCNPPRIGKR